MSAKAVARVVSRLLVLLLVLGALLLLFEKRLIYFPTSALEATPSALGLPHQELALRAEDGVRLNGWFLPVKDSHGSVLVCHGNGGNISHRLDRAMLIQSRLRLDVLLFDYRGYGKSEGSPDEPGTYRDARAAYRWLREHDQAPERIVIFGESLGSAIALELALSAPARGLVLESPFTSIPDMARAVYPFLPVWPLVRTRYDSLGKVGGLRMPLLILHGDRDDVVPFAQGRRLFEAAPLSRNASSRFPARRTTTPTSSVAKRTGGRSPTSWRARRRGRTRAAPEPSRSDLIRGPWTPAARGDAHDETVVPGLQSPMSRVSFGSRVPCSRRWRASSPSRRRRQTKPALALPRATYSPARRGGCARPSPG